MIERQRVQQGGKSTTGKENVKKIVQKSSKENMPGYKKEHTRVQKKDMKGKNGNTQGGAVGNMQGFKERTEGNFKHVSVPLTRFHGLLAFGIQSGGHSLLASILDFYAAKTLGTRLNISLLLQHCKVLSSFYFCSTDRKFLF